LGPGINSFATEYINGLSRTVLRFPAENGVRLTPTTDVIPKGNYTLVALFRFAQITNRRWQRIVDFQDGTSDRGLYSHEGTLELYPYARGTTATIKAEEYVLVVLTRDSAGTVTGYVDGIKQFSYDDSSTDAAVIDANNTLRFFRDNESGGTSGESSAGAVARIQLYDEALTANQVAHLPNVPSTVSGTATANVGSVSFAPQSLGTLSVPQTVVVTNTGHINLRIQRVQIMGANPNDFLLSSDDCSYITLLTHESCSIGVRFAPSASKHRSATLRVRSADLPSPLKIALFGTGGRAIKVIACTKTTSKAKRARHKRTKCATKHHKRRHEAGHTGRRIRLDRAQGNLTRPRRWPLVYLRLLRWDANQQCLNPLFSTSSTR
ncbi:MAG: choice-of-anchor D domain-containing protein, partial [Solirubrobacteraceae bacterium]